MKTDNKNAVILEDVKINVKIKLTVLWSALMFCYIYADLLSFFRPGAVGEMIAGKMGPFPVTQVSLLIASIMMAIPALMVFLSLTLKPKGNRWTNIITGVLYTAVSLINIIGEKWIYYIFFGVIEMVLTLLIVWNAWKWPKQKS